MKLMMLAALAVAAPVAAFAQTTSTPDPAMSQPAPGGDPAAPQTPPADPATPAPADPAAPAPGAPMPGAPMAGAPSPQMGAPMANPAPAAQESYPMCSATVHDQCREGAGGKHMMHRTMRRAHRK